MARLRDETILEGPHMDPDGGDALLALFQIIWCGLVLVVLIVFVIPAQILKWIARRQWRTKREENITEEVKSEEDPPVWRYGY